MLWGVALSALTARFLVAGVTSFKCVFAFVFASQQCTTDR